MKKIPNYITELETFPAGKICGTLIQVEVNKYPPVTLSVSSWNLTIIPLNINGLRPE